MNLKNRPRSFPNVKKMTSLRYMSVVVCSQCYYLHCAPFESCNFLLSFFSFDILISILSLSLIITELKWTLLTLGNIWWRIQWSILGRPDLETDGYASEFDTEHFVLPCRRSMVSRSCMLCFCVWREIGHVFLLFMCVWRESLNVYLIAAFTKWYHSFPGIKIWWMFSVMFMKIF